MRRQHGSDLTLIDLCLIIQIEPLVVNCSVLQHITVQRSIDNNSNTK